MKPKTTLDRQTKITVREFAEAVGVSQRGVQLWLRRQVKRGHNYLRTEQGAPALSLEGAERFLDSRGVPRASTRPRGWPTVKAVMLEAGVEGNKVYRLIREGVLRAQYHGGSLYVHPGDATWFLKTEREAMPLAGWVPLTDVRMEAKRSQQALDSFIRRRDLPTKVFKHPRLSRPSRYMRARDAETYRALAAANGKYTPKVHQGSRCEVNHA